MIKKELLKFGTGLLCVFLLSACVSSTQKRIHRAEAIRGVGEAHLEKGSFSSALKYFLEAETIHPDDHLLQDDLGKAYIAKGEFSLAIQHFKKAVELKPNFAPGKNNLGSAYLLAGDWDAAIKVFNELSSDLLYATPHFPLYNLGWAYYNKKQYKKALVYFKKSLKSQRGFVPALRGTGLVYQAVGQYRLAIKYFSNAARRAPKFQNLHFDLAKAYVSAKQYPKAINSYNRVISIKPDSELADQAQIQINQIKNKTSQ